MSSASRPDLGPIFTTTGATGTLDLKDNVLIVKYLGSSLYDTVKQLLISGYDRMDAGRWDGLGIITSSAVTDPPSTSLGYAEAVNVDFSITSFAAVTIDYDAVLVRYTCEGDANLDGVVNVADLGIIASNWQAGVENYNGPSFQEEWDALMN